MHIWGGGEERARRNNREKGRNNKLGRTGTMVRQLKPAGKNEN